VLNYTEITADVPITGSSGAPTTIITASAAVVLDGTTRIKVSFFCGRVNMILEGANTDGSLTFRLFDSTEIGRLGTIEVGNTTAGLVTTGPVLLQRILTPSAASHTFAIKASADANNNDGNSGVVAGAGGVDTPVPAFLLVERCL
jgi:hypothetical protein